MKFPFVVRSRKTAILTLLGVTAFHALVLCGVMWFVASGSLLADRSSPQRPELPMPTSVPANVPADTAR